MSKSTNQTLALLSVVAGCLATMRHTNAFSRTDMKELVSDTYRETGEVIKQWPCTGNEQKNCKWITERVHGQWSPFIMADKDRYSTAILAAICERIISDLQERIKDKRKLLMLAPLVEPLKTIHNFADPEGRNFPAYQKSDYVLDKLYQIVEWR